MRADSFVEDLARPVWGKKGYAERRVGLRVSPSMGGSQTQCGVKETGGQASSPEQVA